MSKLHPSLFEYDSLPKSQCDKWNDIKLGLSLYFHFLVVPFTNQIAQIVWYYKKY